MQRFPLPALPILLLLCLPGLAAAQTITARPAPAAPAAAPAARPAAPAAPPAATLPSAASTIIPGSPLAALTGVGTPTPKPGSAEPPPFGTETLGFAVTRLVSREAGATVTAFIDAVQKSTALSPVWHWLQSFPHDPARLYQSERIAIGLLAVLLPALVLEAALRWALLAPRRALMRRAARLGLPAQPALVAAEAGETEPAPLPRRNRRGAVLTWFRRLLLGLLHFLLCFIPILGFGLTAGALLAGGFITLRDTHHAIVGVANAYLFCRIVMELQRLFTAPFRPPLRLLRMPDQRALWINRWLRILLITGAVTFAIVSIAELLDLPHRGAMALTRILVLAIHVELAIMIWQSRKVVARWIRGSGDPDSLLAGLRRRFAMVWHYLAIFYVLALWVAWAGGVQNAFAVLLRVVAVFVAALLAGRLAWAGSARLLDRLIPDPQARQVRHPNFFTRARVYSPLIKAMLRAAIAIAAVTAILLGWGIDILPWLFKDPLSRSLISALIAIIITIAIALIVWESANAWLDGRIDRLTAAGKSRQALRLRTTAPILKAAFGTSIFLLAALICLSRIGVNAAPLLAGAGVLGIAIGFGSQKLVQDIITGLFLLLEDTMQVGDVVTLAGMSGTVERLSIRTIRLRGGDGSINIIPFSAVTTVTNQTRDFGFAQISIGVGYHEDPDHVSAVLADIARTMRADPTWGSMIRDDLQINGIDQFGANALIITGQIKTGPGQHWAVRREFSRRVVLRFAEEKITIPYTSNVSTLRLEPDEMMDLIERPRRELAPAGLQNSPLVRGDHS